MEPPASLREFQFRLIEDKPRTDPEVRALLRLDLPCLTDIEATALLSRAVHLWLKQGVLTASIGEPALRPLATNAAKMAPLELAVDAAVIAYSMSDGWMWALAEAAHEVLTLPPDDLALGKASANALLAWCFGSRRELVPQVRALLAPPPHRHGRSLRSDEFGRRRTKGTA
jgi:hypothetical protein